MVTKNFTLSKWIRKNPLPNPKFPEFPKYMTYPPHQKRHNLTPTSNPTLRFPSPNHLVRPFHRSINISRQLRFHMTPSFGPIPFYSPQPTAPSLPGIQILIKFSLLSKISPPLFSRVDNYLYTRFPRTPRQKTKGNHVIKP